MEDLELCRKYFPQFNWIKDNEHQDTCLGSLGEISIEIEIIRTPYNSRQWVSGLITIDENIFVNTEDRQDIGRDAYLEEILIELKSMFVNEYERCTVMLQKIKETLGDLK